jgi:hypothetical protein
MKQMQVSSLLEMELCSFSLVHGDIDSQLYVSYTANFLCALTGAHGLVNLLEEISI